MHAEPVVAASVFEHHRTIHAARKLGRDQVGVLVLVLVAEAAAHVLGDDAHLVILQAEVAGGIVAAIGNPLGRRVQGQLVAFPGRQRATRLHLGIVHETGLVALFENPIRFGKSRFHVADARSHRLELIAGIRAHVAFRPDAGRVIRQRFLGFEHERQFLVYDFDQVQRRLGDITVGGRNRRDRIAHATHRIVEDIAPVNGRVLDRVVVLPPSRNTSRAPDDGAGLVGDHVEHAGQGQSRGNVDGGNARMRMRAAQHPRVDHAGQFDVPGVLRRAGDAFDRVYARGIVADRLQWLKADPGWLRHATPPSPAATTASTMAL